MFSRQAWIFAGIAAALVLVAWIWRLAPRMQAERAHINLAVVLDYQQLFTLAQDEGFPLEEWLAELQEAGFDHVALGEDTPLWLEQRGICTVVEGFSITKSVPQRDLHVEGSQPLVLTPEQQRAQKAKEKPEISYIPDEKIAYAQLDLSPGDLHMLFPIEPGSGNLQAQFAALSAAKRLGEPRVRMAVNEQAGLVIVTLRGDVEELVNLGLGYSSPTYRKLKSAGFAVIPRLRNQRALPQASIVGEIIAEAGKLNLLGPGIFIGEGDEILGYPKALDATTEALQQQGFLFGLVEFAKQSGDKSLADRLVPGVVRVHSISDEEMEIYTPDRALKRYVLAATERNVRVIYLKPFHQDMQGVDLRQYNTDYFISIRSALAAAGFQIASIDNGTLHNELAPWPTDQPSQPPSKLWNIVALIIGVGFPLLALWLLTNRLPHFYERADKGDQLGAAAMALLWLWGWGLMAAMLEAALLSTPHYMLQTRSFSGINLVLLGPVMLATVLWVRVLVQDPPQRIWDQAVLLGNFPIHVKHLAIGGGVLLAMMIIVLRSGNEPVGGVSPIELAFRAVLGDLLGVRPRTKEFLLGHPALVIGLWLLFHRIKAVRPWAFPFLVGGTLGITSVINTFQHYHTPLAISWQRTLLGMGMGLVLGIIACLVLQVLITLLFRNAPPAPDGPEPTEVAA